MRRILSGMMMVGLAVCLTAAAQEPAKQVTWRFNDTASLGGRATKVVGHPKVIETPMGKAIAFNGADGLFVDVHPLAGAETWTWSLPAHFPTGKTLRVTVDGGTLAQNGTPLLWNDHGYYEVALDMGSLTWSR